MKGETGVRAVSEEMMFCEAMRVPSVGESVVACRVNDCVDFAIPTRYIVVGVTKMREYIIKDL